MNFQSTFIFCSRHASHDSLNQTLPLPTLPPYAPFDSPLSLARAFFEVGKPHLDVWADSLLSDKFSYRIGDRKPLGKKSFLVPLFLSCWPLSSLIVTAGPFYHRNQRISGLYLPYWGLFLSQHLSFRMSSQGQRHSPQSVHSPRLTYCCCIWYLPCLFPSCFWPTRKSCRACSRECLSLDWEWKSGLMGGYFILRGGIDVSLRSEWRDFLIVPLAHIPSSCCWNEWLFVSLAFVYLNDDSKQWSSNLRPFVDTEK